MVVDTEGGPKIPCVVCCRTRMTYPGLGLTLNTQQVGVSYRFRLLKVVYLGDTGIHGIVREIRRPMLRVAA